MMKKIITISLVLAMLAALIPVSLANSGTIKPYKGFVGAGSPLYPVKRFIQSMDVTFTFDNTEKMKKQVNYANERVSEMLAGQEEDDPAVIGAAADAYTEDTDRLEKIMQAEDIDQSAYADLEPIFVHHKECIGNITNQTTGLPETVQVQVKNAYNKALNLKNGMPFYYYDDVRYFMPPGQMKKITNGSKIPPGLAKKGYVKPEPIENGSKIEWPWDQIPYPTSIKVRGNGNKK